MIIAIIVSRFLMNYVVWVLPSRLPLVTVNTNNKDDRKRETTSPLLVKGFNDGSVPLRQTSHSLMTLLASPVVNHYYCH